MVLIIRRILVTGFVVVLGLCMGCNLFGLFLNESYSEQNIPPEYNLSARKGEKLLVFVEQSGSLTADPAVVVGLEKTLGVFINERVGLAGEDIILFSNLFNSPELKMSASLASPVEIGKKAGVGMVLYARIDNYELYELPDLGYYSGSIQVRSVLFDVNSGRVVWPLGGKERIVRAGFDFETDGVQAAIGRLGGSTAHCIVRNFYNCPRRAFKISDEKIDMGTW